MGIGPAALKLYVDLASEGVLKRGQSVCELGSQEFVPESCDLAPLWAAFGAHPIPALEGGPGMESGRGLMAHLGFEYDSIDMDGRFGAHAIDLNEAWWSDIGELFDVVTNHGTTEHVFDQARCFGLVHDLTKPGGVMIHLVPSMGARTFPRPHFKDEGIGYGSHGLYLYTPGFFKDLAHANGYEVLKLYDHEDVYGTLLVCALRRGGIAPFRKPIQEIYR